MSDFDLTPLHAALAPLIPQGRPALLPALHAAQAIYGYLPEPVAAAIARALSVPLADVFGVIEFYSLFSSQPRGQRVIRVCTDPACALKGGETLLRHLCAHHHIAEGETSANGAATIERSPCLGLCDHAPAALVNDLAETDIDLHSGSYHLGAPASLVGGELRLLTARCGRGQPASLADYEADGGYQGLQKALAMSPADVIAEIRAAGLVGRGGAAFPTAVKWAGAAQAAGDPKYVICNADESEPGTFKDRALLLDDPHAVIEGLLIAAHAVGAQMGYIYLRGEYPYLLPGLESALFEAAKAGYLHHCNIEIRLGAGAYICGEETALFESIEGKRGFPRVKPPFPTTHGLFGRPTAINNVETLANAPLILRLGAAAYRQWGSEKSPGPKLFCLSGDIARPGIYEAPFGVTLRQLLAQAGGVAGGRRLQAALLGGAAGAFAVEAHLDTRLTFEDLRAAGLPLGSGVVMVFDDTRDLRQTLLQLGRFFAHESCGKCYPCQLGTQRQFEILQRVAARQPLAGDAERLQDVGWTMTDASLCGLGQTAAMATLSALKLWPELFARQ